MNLSLEKKLPATKQAVRLIGLFTFVGAVILMIGLSWGKWPDVLIDFGRELYVPWMLSEGKVLYRDILYFRGPLSPYWNTLCFVLFGPSLFTLVWVNLALLATLVLVIFLVLRRVSTPFTAYIACLVFIFFFAFNQYVGIGNYNYICPYAHEATHGMLLSWVVIVCLMAHIYSPKITWLAISGFVSGMIFLIKPEFFVAVMAATVATQGLLVWQMRPNKYLIIKTSIAFIATLLVPPLIAFILLAAKLSWYDAGVGTLGGWWYIWNSRISESPFFSTGMGFKDFFDNLRTLLISIGIYSYFIVSAIALAIAFRRRQSVIIIAILEAVIVLALAWLFWNYLPLWFEIGRPLPLLLIILGGWNLALLIRKREEKYLAALVLVVFSLALLGKMLLNTRLYHYGFVLAMPAALVMVVAIIDWIPYEIKHKGGRQMLYYTIVFTILGVITVRLIDISAKRYGIKQIVVGKGTDKFLADHRGEHVNLAVEWLNQYAGPHETLLVLPEGVMINYLARLKNSTPIVTAIPSDMLMFGEKRILQLIKETPPTYIALVHSDHTEYGYRFFGLDYGQSIMNWIRVEYRSVYLIGAAPFQGTQFGIHIIKHKDSVPELKQ